MNSFSFGFKESSNRRTFLQKENAYMEEMEQPEERSNQTRMGGKGSGVTLPGFPLVRELPQKKDV